MSLTALVNIFGIAFVMPFVAVAANPDMVHTSKHLSLIYNFLHFSTPVHFIIFLGVLALVMLVLADSIAALTTWLSTRVIEKVKARISYNLYSKYLDKPYEYHLNNNSATLSNNLFRLVTQFTDNYVSQGMKLLSSALSMAAILGFVVFLNPFLALMTVVVMGSVYSIIYLSVKRTLDKNSNSLVKNSEAAFRLANESFGGIKDIKLKGNENIFKSLFLPRLMDQANSSAVNSCIAVMPKYVLEVIAFGGIILLTLGLILSGQKTTTVIPIISAYVYAGYRLMPVLQQTFASLSSLRTASKHLDTLYESVVDQDAPPSSTKKSAEKMDFGQVFELKGVSYRYSGYERLVLNNINLRVKHNDIVGVIGSTGAGKTTLIDIILGLLEPTVGSLFVDGCILDTTEKLASWQKSMGYVPQFIYLSDSTIKENIAFGEDPRNLDIDRVKEVAGIAAISEFIENELPDSYDTVVGERGVKLSGGQIQRIGIARALYNNPSVLVLDEATSSLDSNTEAEVMQAIYDMKDTITIIIIAHRLSTVACCDKVVLMEKGQIVEEGEFSTLTDRHDSLVSPIEEMAK